MNIRRVLHKPLSWLPARALSTAVASGTMELPKSSVHNSSHRPLKMSGWQLHNYGDVEDLQHNNNLRMPQIRCPSDCLVRVRSTSVNPIDVAMLRGYGAAVLNVLRFPGDLSAIEFPLTLGREFCGEIVQTGMSAGTKELYTGQRVWGVVPLDRNGAHAEYVSVPNTCIAPAPSSLTNEQAAAVLYTGLTAWSGLYITGQLGGLCGALTSRGGGGGGGVGAKKRILILGGSGSVGSMAIQMLRAQNAQIVATCNANAINLVEQSFGANVAIDYDNPVAMEEMRGYQPYDIVLDCAGLGAEGADTLNVQFRQYITFSSPMLRNIDQSGIAVGLLKNAVNLMETNARAFTQRGGLIKWGFFTPAPQGIEFLAHLVERGKLLPSIDSRFEINRLPEAFAKVQAGHLRGKVIVNFN